MVDTNFEVRIGIKTPLELTDSIGYRQKKLREEHSTHVEEEIEVLQRRYRELGQLTHLELEDIGNAVDIRQQKLTQIGSRPTDQLEKRGIENEIRILNNTKRIREYEDRVNGKNTLDLNESIDFREKKLKSITDPNERELLQQELIIAKQRSDLLRRLQNKPNIAEVDISIKSRKTYLSTLSDSPKDMRTRKKIEMEIRILEERRLIKNIQTEQVTKLSSPPIEEQPRLLNQEITSPDTILQKLWKRVRQQMAPTNKNRTSKPEDTQLMSRRQFLTLGGAAAATIPLAAGIIHHERQMALEDIFTIDGIRYQPLYENHTEGPKVALRNDAVAVFLEINYEGIFNTHYNLPANHLINGLSRTDNTRNMLGIARRNNMVLAIGDIATDRMTYEYFTHLSSTAKSAFVLGLGEIVLGFTPELVRQRIIKKFEQEPAQEEPHSNQQLSRREFLIMLRTAAITTAASGVITTYDGIGRIVSSNQFKESTIDVANRSDHWDRTLQRIYGLGSQFNPSDTLLFTRNVLMALKIKTLGEHLKEQVNGTEGDPLVAFNVGAAHVGIEDLLYLPTDCLRAILAYVQRSDTNEAYDVYGDDIATTRLIQSTDDGNYTDIPALRDTRLLSMLGK